MTNIYWPVYKNLESELNKLTFVIHIDDNQLNTITTQLSEKFGEIKANPRELLKAIIKTLDLLQKDPGTELKAILPQLNFANE